MTNDYDSSASREDNFSIHGNREQGYAKLPADNSAMTLAIIATVLLVLCCCCGGQYLAIVLSAIGYALAHISIQKYDDDPYSYAPESAQKVRNAKTFNLVVLIMSFLLMAISFLDVFETTFHWGEEDFEEYFERVIENQIDESSDQIDSTSDEVDDWYYEEDIDTLEQKQDSTDLIEL